jgi:uncharacterized protein (TIGR02246 family)
MHTVNDEELLKRLFENIAAAWNTYDVKLFASYYTDDCDYITFTGECVKGRLAIAACHRDMFDGILRDSILIKHLRSIRFVTPHVAIVQQAGAVKLKFQQQVLTTKRSIHTNVVVKERGEWKITAFYDSPVQKRGFIKKLARWLDGR